MSSDDRGDSAPAHPEDLRLVRAALEGDSSAAAVIEKEHRGMIIRVLMARGVQADVAENVAADLISECFGARKNGEIGSARMASYKGGAALSTWLVRSAWNKWLDLHRRDKFRGEIPQQYDQEGVGDAFDQLAGKEEEGTLEPDLAEMLRKAISAAFESLDPNVLLIMKLICVRQVNQQTVAQMWGWSQPKVSRALASARKHIERETLEELQRRDPDLDVRWEDFRELCRLSPGSIL